MHQDTLMDSDVLEHNIDLCTTETETVQRVYQPLCSTEQREAVQRVHQHLCSTEQREAVQRVYQPLCSTEQREAVQRVYQPLCCTEQREAVQRVYQPLCSAEQREAVQRVYQPLCSTEQREAVQKASLTTGILVLLMGVAALGTGLLVPPKIEGFGEGELQVVDQQAIEYNQALERCTLAGGILLMLGGTALLACTLICPLRRVLEKPKGEDAQHLLLRTGGHSEPRSRASVPTVSSLDSRLPVRLAHMQNIQPRPRS
ncbi:UNVERIFIED_CONTAM: hypothetical protein FKN15_060131 [Acipenser sinensis]